MSEKFSTDRVISGLRAKIESPAAWLPQFIQSNADVSDPSDLLGFISGALRHQARLAEPRENQVGTVSFVAILRESEVIERKDKSGHLIGTKGLIVLEPVSGKAGRDGKEKKDEEITTGWISQTGGTTDAFETALANSILDLAEDNLDAEVLVTKWTTENREGDKFKQILDLRVLRGAK